MILYKAETSVYTSIEECVKEAKHIMETTLWDDDEMFPVPVYNKYE